MSSSYNLTFVKNTILQRDSLLKILIHLGRIYFALGEGGTGWGRIWAAHTCRLFQRFLPRRSFTKAVILSTQTEMCWKLGWPSGSYTSVSATTFSHLSHLGDLDHFELCHSWYFSVQFKFEYKGKRTGLLCFKLSQKISEVSLEIAQHLLINWYPMALRGNEQSQLYELTGWWLETFHSQIFSYE